MPDGDPYGEFFTNEDGSLRAFTESEINEMEIETLGIEEGSHPRHSRGPGQGTIECEYLVNADYLGRFYAFMFGGCKLYDDEGTTRLSRLMPQRWPDNDSFAAVSGPPTTAHVFEQDDTISADFPIPTHSKVKVPIVFQHMPFDMVDDLEPEGSVNETRRYVQHLPSSTSFDYLTLPGGILRFKRESGAAAPDGKPIPHNVGKPMVQTVITKRWIRVPHDAWIPGSSLYNRVFGSSEDDTTICAGCINDDVFLGYQPGQLLFIGVDDELQIDPAGPWLNWNLTYKFLLKPNGHNWFYYYPTDGSSSAGWYFVTNDETWYATTDLPDGVSLFNARNLLTLFRVGA